MKWDDDLFDEQKSAAAHFGCHARLLAGPGTGKTLTIARRIAYLITERKIPSEEILALTFTRAATAELRNRVNAILGNEYSLPRIVTLHSFALRQLMRNSNRVETLPRPLRIADDWEERNIIIEDLKTILNYNVKTVKERFHELSADWQTLEAENENWETMFPDPRFLGAWRSHRSIYGYTLRSELVYQLKRALEQSGEFILESQFKYLIVDEYQDLNRCDLAIIYALRDMGMEVYSAGDDDQSIYGFRYAYPDGIKSFDKNYEPHSLMALKTCIRCDKSIIDISTFVAELDPARLPKPLNPRSDAANGSVLLLRFPNEVFEASGVARVVKLLIEGKGFSPEKILILVRSDHHNAFSDPLRDSLTALGIPVSSRIDKTPIDSKEGRILVSILRLLSNPDDSLAWRTILESRDNNIGKKSISEIYNLAHASGFNFVQCLKKIIDNPSLISSLGTRVSKEVSELGNIIANFKPLFQANVEDKSDNNLVELLEALAEAIIPSVTQRENILQYLYNIIVEVACVDFIDLLTSLAASDETIEQEIEKDKVNILTMHKAKGLTAEAVIIIAAEDQYLPGRHESGPQEGDERRLFYVSLSRAKHNLIITYCERRGGRQGRTGRNNGSSKRSLTRYLIDAPIKPFEGTRTIYELEQKPIKK